MKDNLKQEVYDKLKKRCMEIKRADESMSVTQMLIELMDMEGVPMYCSYHHFMVPAAILTQTAILEGRGETELRQWLEMAEERTKTIPTGFCGECGICGAAVGIGLFILIYTGSEPKSTDNWQQANEATGLCLQKIASSLGTGCCKRNSLLAVEEGVAFINEKWGLTLSIDEHLICKYHDLNAECLEAQCPFYKEQ